MLSNMFAIKTWTCVTLFACNYYLINLNTRVVMSIDIYIRSSTQHVVRTCTYIYAPRVVFY